MFEFIYKIFTSRTLLPPPMSLIIVLIMFMLLIRILQSIYFIFKYANFYAFLIFASGDILSMMFLSLIPYKHLVFNVGHCNVKEESCKET